MSEPIGSLDELIGASPLALEAVEVADLGRKVYVREMGAREMESFSRMAESDGVPAARAMATIVALTLADAEGQLLCTPDDVPKLMEMRLSTLQQIANAGMRLSGLTAEAVEQAGKD